MKLQDLFAELTPEQRALQLGIAEADPLTGSFPRKRVVHAGLQGELVTPDQAQEIWQGFMMSKPDGKKPQTVYIHIPFCKTKCLYCGFFQNGTQQAVEDAYMDRLIKEIERESDLPRMKNSRIQTVFIGGGTPTSLSAANATRLLQAIRRCFPLTNDYELTLEGRVHDLIPEKIDAWMANGVNRMSLGVQSFDTKVRQQLGRLDTQETVLERLQALKDYQQCSVVIDLIYGLPDQTMDVWEKDLQLLYESGIDGADLYQLNVFDGSDLNKAIKEGRLSPASTTAKQAEMFAFAHDYLTKRSFKRLSICHWSINNRERSLYNSMAKSGAEMFLYGCGAGGTMEGYTAMNHRMLKAYEGMVDAGQKPFMVLMKSHDLQPIANNVVNQLERGSIDLKQVVAMDSRLSELEWLYNTWEKQGLVKYNGFLYELTIPGQFWQVNIAQSTLECIQSLLTGKNTLAVQRIAAQENKEQGHMKAMKKMMDAMAPEAREKMMAQMMAMKKMMNEGQGNSHGRPHGMAKAPVNEGGAMNPELLRGEPDL